MKGKICGVFLFLIVGLNVMHAQVRQANDNQVKAGFLLNFSEFVEWPPSSFESDSSAFIIGIIGRNPFGSYLDEMVKDKLVKGHPIQVEYYRTVNDVGNCHILFVESSAPARAIVGALLSRSILTVGEANNFARVGGMIRLYKSGNKISMEINPLVAKEANLTISSKLLSLAQIVN